MCDADHLAPIAAAKKSCFKIIYEWLTLIRYFSKLNCQPQFQLNQFHPEICEWVNVKDSLSGKLEKNAVVNTNSRRYSESIVFNFALIYPYIVMTWSLPVIGTVFLDICWITVSEFLMA